MPKRLILLLLALSSCKVSPEARRDHIASDMENVLVDNLLNTWYPRCVDSLHGGFLSAFTFDFAPAENQEKMIVTQARHTWTNAKAAMRYPDIAHFKTSAAHGFEFLRDVMWDKQYGGFFQLVTRQGKSKDATNKTDYGNVVGV